MNNVSNLYFKVKKIIYRNDKNRYAIARVVILKESLNLKISKESTVKGVFPSIFEGDEFIADSIYTLNTTYGYYFNLISVPIVKIPENQKSLISFMKKRLKGIGLSKVKAIVERLGVDAIREIKKDYEVLLNIDGINENIALKIKNKLSQYDSLEELIILIKSMGIKTSVAIDIYEKYDETSISKIKENPYCICLDDIDFKYADKIAFNLNKSALNKERIKYGILEYLEFKLKSFGHLCIYEKMIFDKLEQFLNSFKTFEKVDIPKELITKALNELLEEFKIVIEEDDSRERYVYKKVWNTIENKTAFYLKNFLDTKNNFINDSNRYKIDEFIKKYEYDNFKLDSKQKEAIYMTFNNKISILTGCPGTGKTQTISAIVNCIKYIKKDADIVLLAPTGKASSRMSELINMEAKTIHRGLKIHCFSTNSQIETIVADYVIVDESSMIDSYLFYKLISSIDIKTNLLFIGDSNQLPSVGPGLILRDMISSKLIKTVQLTKIFRQAESSFIVKNANKIIEGKTTGDKDGIDISNKKGSNFIFLKELDINVVRDKINKSIDRLIDKGYSPEDICVLTAMKKRELGSDSLNLLLQEKLNPRKSLEDEYEVNDMLRFRVNDRVIHIKNNYELDVYNGEMGTISKIFYEHKNGILVAMMKVKYKDRDIIYNEEQFEELELAYAITIHKSQGSEIKAVIIPIHLQQKILLSKNLIYTGITRAKDIAIIIGSEDCFNYAIKRTEAYKRITRFKEKLCSVYNSKLA